MYSFKFVIVKKYIEAMVTCTNTKNITLIVEIVEMIYDMFYNFWKNLRYMGGFQLLYLIITELKSHVTCYNSMPRIG